MIILEMDLQNEAKTKENILKKSRLYMPNCRFLFQS